MKKWWKMSYMFDDKWCDIYFSRVIYIVQQNIIIFTLDTELQPCDYIFVNTYTYFIYRHFFNTFWHFFYTFLYIFYVFLHIFLYYFYSTFFLHLSTPFYIFYTFSTIFSTLFTHFFQKKKDQQKHKIQNRKKRNPLIFFFHFDTISYI